MKKALVYGAGGFIGSHMVKYLKSKNYYVRGIDLKYPEYSRFRFWKLTSKCRTDKGLGNVSRSLLKGGSHWLNL